MVNLITNIPIQYGREDGGEANFEYLHQLQADGLTDEKLEKYGMEGFSYIQKADRDTALMKDAEESDEHKKTGESIYKNCFLTLWSDLRLEDFKWGHKTWDEL